MREPTTNLAAGVAVAGAAAVPEPGLTLPDPWAQPSTYELAILRGLQGRVIFAGLNYHHPTKTTGTRAARRAANKRQKAGRRASRG